MSRATPSGVPQITGASSSSLPKSISMLGIAPCMTTPRKSAASTAWTLAPPECATGSVRSDSPAFSIVTDSYRWNALSISRAASSNQSGQFSTTPMMRIPFRSAPNTRHRPALRV